MKNVEGPKLMSKLMGSRSKFINNYYNYAYILHEPHSFERQHKFFSTTD